MIDEADGVGPHAELVESVTAAIGPCRVVADRSWDHGEAQVVEIVDAERRTWFAKQHLSEASYARERHAYRDWVPALADRAPELRHADDATQTLVVSGVPGRACTRREPEVHRQAGALLHRFHHAGPALSAAANPARMVEKLERWLSVGDGLLGSGEADFARARVRELAGLPELEQRPCHLDYQPRNWLDDGGTIRIIDFGRARYDVWVRDLDRLYFGDWVDRPDLREAFLDGYGRGLEGDELATLLCYGAYAAATTIVWARQHNDAEFEAQGRRNLAHLLSTSRPGVGT